MTFSLLTYRYHFVNPFILNHLIEIIFLLIIKFVAKINFKQHQKAQKYFLLTISRLQVHNTQTYLYGMPNNNICVTSAAPLISLSVRNNHNEYNWHKTAGTIIMLNVMKAYSISDL